MYPAGPQKVMINWRKFFLSVWEKIPPKQFEALWNSVPDGVQAVFEAKGWYTRY